jgi:phosphoribosyl 1,2-cyclic phosphodiesterase
VLVDAGLSARETQRRLAERGLQGGLDAILITHEHGDHVAHVSRLSRVFEAPVHVNAGTRAAAGRHFDRVYGVVTIDSERAFGVGALGIQPVRKPHDAADPVSFLISHGSHTLGVITDQGEIDAPTREAMELCTALVLEANHDPGMLASGPYPPHLKRRVGGRRGHLSNAQSARALAAASSERLRLVVLGHLSTKNNDARIVRREFLRHGGADPGYPRWISFQDRPTPVFDLERAATLAVTG